MTTTACAATCVVEEVTKRFGERVALERVSFEVGRGEIFGLLGPNGGGKTTLFRIISTLLTPTSGRVRVDGVCVRERPAKVRRQIGIVFQSPSIDLKLTVRENLHYHGALFGLGGSALAGRIDDLLGRFDLLERSGDLAEALSGGLRRRVDLARGMLHRPSLLLLDEPSTGLDPQARRDLWGQLERLRDEEGTTVLLTTHILAEAEGCGRVAILDRGRLVAAGAPDALKSEIGADVISVVARDAEALARGLRERFSIEATPLNGRLRFERADGHEFIPTLIEAFQGEVKAVTLGRPSLEDVFIRKTGRAFTDAPEVETQGAGR